MKNDLESFGRSKGHCWVVFRNNFTFFLKNWSKIGEFMELLVYWSKYKFVSEFDCSFHSWESVRFVYWSDCWMLFVVLYPVLFVKILFLRELSNFYRSLICLLRSLLWSLVVRKWLYLLRLVFYKYQRRVYRFLIFRVIYKKLIRILLCKYYLKVDIIEDF